MKRKDLEKYLGKRVAVTLFDNDVCVGVLQIGDGFFKNPKWYNLTESNMVFRTSHVKKVVEVK